MAISDFYHFDGLGSVSTLNRVGPTNLLARYLYRAFGETTRLSGTVVQPFQWVGQLGYYYDVDLLNYYLRARDYDPKLARFLSQDPIGFDGDPSNQYRYAGNEPTDAVDPTGEVEFKITPEKVASMDWYTSTLGDKGEVVQEPRQARPATSAGHAQAG